MTLKDPPLRNIDLKGPSWSRAFCGVLQSQGYSSILSIAAFPGF